MEFICALLRRIHDDDATPLSTAVDETYRATLMQFHGFFVSNAFWLAFKFVPSREEFLASVGGSGPQVMGEMSAFVDGFSAILEEIHKWMVEQGLNDPTKV
ncbi:hypothetical protein HXX76_004549 [Chlamydomonas incerta]|uniref:Glycolipid transfer protein domain-containing protein n=1 Tax=Chlamydomonas incerta TaxID=51695 RepID=A0A835TI52_CHLIN|nr:hypothetical protein HXX76_004549 [Chlamydomonas incerta]|eukprot:KAG2439185.1 hypothetical protein HXX76_004549 [Chlamydomonas incerta]